MEEKVQKAVEETQRGGVNTVSRSTQGLQESLGYLGHIAEMISSVGSRVSEVKEQAERTREEVEKALKLWRISQPVPRKRPPVPKR